MSALFYIGILSALASLVPMVILNGKMMRDKAAYENLPLKLSEIKATYRKKRFYLGLFQVAAILLAIIGLAV